MVIHTKLLQQAVALAKQAGEIILSIYQQPMPAAIDLKTDHSPVTRADLLSHHFLCAHLQALIPGLPILSEESANAALIDNKDWTRFWLIDPLDGTKGFIDRQGDFTINIALIEKQQPVLGVIYQPVTDRSYFAQQGQGAYKQHHADKPQLIHVRSLPKEPWHVVASRHHGDAQLKSFLAQLPVHTVTYCASAIKFCQVAEGTADIYPRFTPTALWDTAAGQCILQAAGGRVEDLAGQSLHYHPTVSLLNPAFIASADIGITNVSSSPLDFNRQTK